MARGLQKTEYMDKALDLRYVEQRGKWYPSTSSANRSKGSRSAIDRRDQSQYDSISPIRSENGMYKPTQARLGSNKKLQNNGQQKLTS